MILLYDCFVSPLSTMSFSLCLISSDSCPFCYDRRSFLLRNIPQPPLSLFFSLYIFIHIHIYHNLYSFHHLPHTPSTRETNSLGGEKKERKKAIPLTLMTQHTSSPILPPQSFHDHYSNETDRDDHKSFPTHKLRYRRSHNSSQRAHAPSRVIFTLLLTFVPLDDSRKATDQ
jgi:hypothetical protein